ncbi:MAG: hypothetical protein U0746_07960 [Gemmataceae bacterium]
MPSTPLTIPDDVHEYAERQVAEGRSPTVEDYLAGLVREDQRRRAKAHLDTTDDAIDVVRVVHGARDLDTLFRDDPDPL